MQRTPPETTEARRPTSDATTPASRLPRFGAPATCANSIPDSRPRRWSGVGAHQDRGAEDGAEEVGAAGEREEEEREPERRREAEDHDRGAPDACRDRDREPLPARARRPAREERRRRALRRTAPRRGSRRSSRRRRTRARRAPGRARVGMPKIIAFVSTTKMPMIACLPFRNRKPVGDRRAGSAGLGLARRRDPRQQPDRDERRRIASRGRCRSVHGKPTAAIRMPAERRAGDGGEAPVDALERDRRRRSRRRGRAAA